MKISKLAMVSIVLLAILTFGTVSASDNFDNLTASDDAISSSVDDAIVVDENVDVGVEGLEEEVVDDSGEFYEVEIPDEIAIDYSDSKVVEYYFSEEVSGNVTIVLGDVEVYLDKAFERNWIYLYELETNNFDFGMYTMNFVYSGDENHQGFTLSKDVNLTYHFGIHRSNDYADESIVAYGDELHYGIDLPENEGNMVYTINGKKYSLDSFDIYSDDFRISPDELRFGKNEITFEYVSKYYPKKVIVDEFDVVGVVYPIGDIDYDGVAYVGTILPTDAKGNMDVYEVLLNENESIYELKFIKSVAFVNGIANVSLSNMSIGHHNIYVNYTGDDYYIFTPSGFNYGEGDYDFGFNVNPKITYPKQVWVNGNYDGYVVKYQLPENYNGNLAVEIGEEKRTFNVEDGAIIFTLFNLDTYDYLWEDDATGMRTLGMYLDYEDDEGNSFHNVVYIGVRDVNPQLNLNLSDTSHQVLVKNHGKYYNSVDFPETAGGNITIYVDGTLYDVVEIEDWDYFASVSIDAHFGDGEHYITFEYSGNEYFLPETFYDTFSVVNFGYYVEDIVLVGKYFGLDDEYLTAYIPFDAIGDVKLIIDGVDVETKRPIDGEVEFDLENIALGDHTFTLVYRNGNYPDAEESGNFTVIYGFEDSYDYIYGSDSFMEFAFPIGATGDAFININNIKYKLKIDENGIAKFKLPSSIVAGEYEATISYSGDDKYPEYSWEAYVDVYYNIQVDNPYEIYRGDLANYSVSINLPNDATGSLVVYERTFYGGEDDEDILTEIISAKVVNGKAKITLNQLSSYLIDNIYNDIIVRYNGTDYNVSESWFDFIVYPFKLIGPEDSMKIYLNTPVQYTLRGPENVTGYLRVLRCVDDEKYDLFNASIENGVAVVSFDDLYLGRYTFLFEYVGSDFEFEREVSLWIWPENLTINDEGSGDDVMVDVKMPKDIKGNLTAIFYNKVHELESGEKYFNLTVPFVNGDAVVKASDLNVGKYVLYAFEVHDETGIYEYYPWMSAGKIGKFTVNYMKSDNSKKNPDLSITADSIVFGDDLIVNVHAASDIKYRVNVSVGGMSKLVGLKNGVGTVKFSGLDKGTYVVTAYYGGYRVGDKNYLNSSVSTTVKVSRGSANLNVSANSIGYGEDLVVNVQTTSDIKYRVNVSVGGMSKLVGLKNGVGSVKFSGLTIGSYTVTAYYGGYRVGDKNYLNSSVSTTVKVSRGLTNLNVSANSIGYGEDLVVNVQTTSDIKYRVNVSVGGMSKLVSLKNGVGSVKFSGLASGSYVVTAYYGGYRVGDKNYLNSSVNTTVKVNKATAPIKATAKAVAYGNDLVVEVQMPSDVTRRVSVTVGNETKLVSLNDGKGTVRFSGLAAGTYSILTSYNGDTNYIKASQNITAKVTKATPEIQITANNISYGQVLTVDVKLPSDVAKRAVLNICNDVNANYPLGYNDSTSKYITLKQGVGSVKLSGLPAGAYAIEVSYVGDANYKKATAVTTIEVKD